MFNVTVCHLVLVTDTAGIYIFKNLNFSDDFSQEADQEGLLTMIYCIFSLADCGGCILLNYLMQRFKTFPLKAFNSDSGKIKF